MPKETEIGSSKNFWSGHNIFLEFLFLSLIYFKKSRLKNGLRGEVIVYSYSLDFITGKMKVLLSGAGQVYSVFSLKKLPAMARNKPDETVESEQKQ